MLDVRQQMIDMVYRIQDLICADLSTLDDSNFREDVWSRKEGGGGRSRVFSGGKVFEKAGVNVSVVYGTLETEAAKAMGGGKKSSDNDLDFFATGISLVLHPHNPMAPSVHANYRYFERGDGQSDGSWWFGGGADLTPSYLFEEDIRHFHSVLKASCDRHEVASYSKFKAWCDEYFFIPHRGECRGVGGIFFDDLNQKDRQSCFDFVEDCASSFLDSYMPIVKKRKEMPFTEKNKQWQQLRRGRYVEFNLVYDRGTTFGLRTNGRIESILMSLPLTARWEYCHEVEPGSREDDLMSVVKNPVEWLQ